MELIRSPLLLDANLQAYYRLTNTSDFKGGTAFTNSGVTFTTGKFGLCADFTDTNNDYLSVNDSHSVLNACSISLWYWCSQNQSGFDKNSICEVAQATNDVKYSIWYDNNNGTPRLDFARDRHNVKRDNTTYNINMADSTWRHIVLTYDGTNVRGYLNGSLVAGPTAASGNGNAGQVDRTVIGTVEALNAYFCDYSKVDDVAIFNDALGAAEVAALYGGRVAGGGFILSNL